MADKGRIQHWNTEKGYGFIHADAGGDDIFIHFTDIDGGGSLITGDLVTYEIGPSRGGRRRRAVRVTLVEPVA